MTKGKTASAAPAPICLLADSQLLFERDEHASCLVRAKSWVSEKDPGGDREPLAVYVGVSNGDAPMFWELFEVAADAAGIRRRQWVRASYDREQAEALSEADIIVLAGGDVRRGLEVFRDTGMAKVIARRHLAGAALIGISAGAVQLGYGVLDEGIPEPGLRLVPFLIGAHEERDAWRHLSEGVRKCAGKVDGIGIPLGGGMMYHPDHTVEAIRLPLNGFRWQDGALEKSLCLPRTVNDTLKSRRRQGAEQHG